MLVNFAIITHLAAVERIFENTLNLTTTYRLASAIICREAFLLQYRGGSEIISVQKPYFACKSRKTTKDLSIKNGQV